MLSLSEFKKLAGKEADNLMDEQIKDSKRSKIQRQAQPNQRSHSC